MNTAIAINQLEQLEVGDIVRESAQQQLLIIAKVVKTEGNLLTAHVFSFDQSATPIYLYATPAELVFQQPLLNDPDAFTPEQIDTIKRAIAWGNQANLTPESKPFALLGQYLSPRDRFVLDRLWHEGFIYSGLGEIIDNCLLVDDDSFADFEQYQQLDNWAIYYLSERLDDDEFCLSISIANLTATHQEFLEVLCIDTWQQCKTFDRKPSETEIKTCLDIATKLIQDALTEWNTQGQLTLPLNIDPLPECDRPILAALLVNGFDYLNLEDVERASITYQHHQTIGNWAIYFDTWDKGNNTKHQSYIDIYCVNQALGNYYEINCSGTWTQRFFYPNNFSDKDLQSCLESTCTIIESAHKKAGVEGQPARA